MKINIALKIQIVAFKIKDKNPLPEDLCFFVNFHELFKNLSVAFLRLSITDCICLCPLPSFAIANIPLFFLMYNFLIII